MVPALTCWRRDSRNSAEGVVMTCTTNSSFDSSSSGESEEELGGGRASSSCFTAAASSAFAATIVMRCAAPDFILASFAGTRMVPAIKAGISSVKRMNVLDRMRSRYSRWTMSQTLCIFSYNVDENLFQRRFQKLKPGDARLGGCRAQQLLGVGPGFQADFHIVAVIVEGLHQV